MTPQLLSAMVFRLNREPRSHTGWAVPALDPYGSYSIIDYRYGWNAARSWGSVAP